MSREIKFRYWHKKDKEIYYPTTIDFDELGDAFHVDVFSVKNGDVILMQYTGLKDKNGVDIYEGDIIRFKCPIHTKGVGEVFYNVDFCCYQISNGLYDLLYEANERLLEVIGNIFQDPALLPTESE
jgi:uncharacterized phage protein (TIGR01671 family)